MPPSSHAAGSCAPVTGSTISPSTALYIAGVDSIANRFTQAQDEASNIHVSVRNVEPLSPPMMMRRVNVSEPKVATAASERDGGRTAATRHVPNFKQRTCGFM